MSSKEKSLAVELLGETRAAILFALLDSDVTVPQISKNLGIIQPGVRKHLEYMENIGIVASFFKQNGLGRPKKYYMITSLGRSLYPKMYDRFLTSILSRLSRLNIPQKGEAGQKLSDHLMGEVASELAETFKSSTNSLSFKEKIKAFEGFLNGLGFSSRVELKDDGSVSIVRRDCALYNVALKNYGTVCLGFDSLLVAKCLEAESRVTLERCMALGKRTCEHVVKL